MTTTPEARIAAVLVEHIHYGSGECRCGWGKDADPAKSIEQFWGHQAAVIAALADIAIVPRGGLRRIYRAASTLGDRYMMPQHFGTDLEEAQRWYKLHQSALDGLPGVDTVRLEYGDELVTDWTPLAAGGES